MGPLRRWEWLRNGSPPLLHILRGIRVQCEPSSDIKWPLYNSLDIFYRLMILHLPEAPLSPSVVPSSVTPQSTSHWPFGSNNWCWRRTACLTVTYLPRWWGISVGKRWRLVRRARLEFHWNCVSAGLRHPNTISCCTDRDISRVKDLRLKSHADKRSNNLTKSDKDTLSEEEIGGEEVTN